MNRWNPLADYWELPPHRSRRPVRSRTKMVHFSQSILSGLTRPRHLALFAVLAAIAVPSTADARIGGYDGVWNVTFATTRGNCSSGYSVPFTVTGSRVSSAGGGRVSGKVNRGGAVAVQVSVGASHASGGGRLGGAAGAGSWRGVISGDQCSGTWQATRT
ncbi:hypothetical protein XH86_00665 [Bradyrhizobium guangdongense]|uniref:Heme utilization protein n=2 Tax=Bradyrhizobium guangdongense TaxID=1325090 RepID=A0ABX6U7P5_9BRAD|nr:hypothetical protein X265_00665 [Bradyrhizobium guangdongense]QOZ57415.1 hypothetical protein XH86_00665 [Bradyrhizobium guangdongense]